MAISSKIYTLSKERLASLLYDLYINDYNAFIYTVNSQLNNWDRRNMALLFIHNTLITFNSIYDALLS